MEWKPKPLGIPSAKYWQNRLSCQGCQLPLTPPVFYCQTHNAIHPLCNYCSYCNNCHGRVGRSLNRCVILEKILAVTKFKCQFQCKTEELSASEYRVHVKRCHLRPIQCILCNDKILFRAYFEHLRDYHKIAKKLPRSFEHGNFNFYDFDSQPSIQYNHTGDKVIFFRYENKKFWIEILSEEEDAEMDYFSNYEMRGPISTLEGNLKFLSARSSHEGTIPMNPENYNHRLSVSSQNSMSPSGLKNFLKIPQGGELDLWIVCEDDNSISSIESEWENHPEQSDMFPSYVSKLVDEVTDLLQQKRSSLAHVVVPSSFRNRLSIAEEFDTFDTFDTESSITPINSPMVSYKMKNSHEETIVLDPAVVKKKLERREHILAEIINTERNYVKDMEEILEGYGEERTSTDEELMQLLPRQLTTYTQINQRPGDYGYTPELCYKGILLGNLDEIYEFQSKEFLPQLEEAFQNASIEAVGTAFLETHHRFLSLYSRYCQLLPAVTAVQREIGEDNPWMELCRSKLNHRLSLGAYIMKPVQRITKYHLLLKDLLNNSEDCPGFPVLYEALSQMLEVLRAVDERMLQRNIVDYPYPLEDEGPMQLQAPFILWTDANRRSSGRRRHLFLYARSILVCKRRQTESNDEELHFKIKISLTDIGLTEAPKGIDPSTLPTSFELWTPPRRANSLVYSLQAETPEIRNIWVDAIKASLMDQFKTAQNVAARKKSSLSASSSFSSFGSSYA